MKIPLLWIGAGVALFVLRKNVVNSLASITDKATWTRKMYAVIDTELNNLPLLSKFIVLAQAVLESGYGQNRAGKVGNNYFNITAGNSWKGEKWLCSGCDKDGRGNPIDQVWRKYSSVNAAVLDYWNFLGPNQNSGRYAVAQQALLLGNLPGFVHGLYRGGYFTSDPSQYLTSMTNVVATVQRFVKKLA